MKIYVLKYEDTEKQTTVKNEFFNKKQLIDQINECAKKGFTILDVLESNLSSRLD
ncbi:hypothetical protein [Clostridium magnum]|uniref:Uncharacterized protein n=1 Tax=Clostridium magnum DSM 2767 TaxID=1121326 RepID=A0A162S225_9CLOT|nr:hypothetical protein [Clostridium magnum]KZL90679.1 hypothetical protein CLMAG_35790 [Clostridium magnum DSM 2767]SHI39829.1 hypothetical protein SAMN02745944_04245 [Clostridium magnum DSM 2767]